MLNPLAVSRGCHYLENALRLAVLAELAYRNDPAQGLAEFADHYRRLHSFSMEGTFGFVASDEQNVVVALRGTDQVIDWITNLTVAQVPGLGGHMHEGFSDALDLVWDELLARVRTLQDQGQTVWVTGHSLGGALATLAAARLADEGIEPYVTCTFGAPRCFDPKASSGYLPRLYRFINKGDLVPTVPPPFTLPWYRYQHAGSLTVTLDKERDATTKLGGKESTIAAMLRWFFKPSLAELSKNLTQALTDHAMKSYISLIKEELGPETVRRMEEGRQLPANPALRIKPRRALAA